MGKLKNGRVEKSPWRKIREVTNGQTTGLLETGCLRIRRLCVIQSWWFLNKITMQYESVGCTTTNYALPWTGMQKEVLTVLKITDSKFLSSYICFSFLQGDPTTNKICDIYYRWIMKTISPDATQASRAQFAHCYKQIMEILISVGQNEMGWACGAYGWGEGVV